MISAATSLPVRIVVCLLSLAVAVGSALETFRIGDSGAKAVWEKRTSGHTGDGANGLTGGRAVSLPTSLHRGTYVSAPYPLLPDRAPGTRASTATRTSSSASPASSPKSG